VVFVLGSLSYLWTASLVAPLALHGWRSTPYNELADAFLHLRLWVAHLPAHPHGSEPLNPRLRPAVLKRYPDFALKGRYVYLAWGPAPAVVLLIPLHLLGFEPSGGVIILPFAIAGLGFTLAALRTVVRQVSEVPLWMTVLAALTLTYGSILLYLGQHPLVYYQAVAAADCFAMAGVWLAISAVAARSASLWRCGLMSLCFGLATASRPTLGVTTVILVAVYMSLRSTGQARGWVAALVLPIALCFILLAGYDQARFADPLQWGTQYQLNGSYHNSDWGSLGYVPLGLWSYLVTPPHPSVVFPFLSLSVPQLSYPLSLPAHYLASSEETGGLLTISPVIVFLVALPWIWRRRPQLLGPLGGPLLAIGYAGVVCLVFISYEIFATTERYEGDFASLLLLGALSVWLALACATSVRRRRLIAVIGGVLAAWSCLAGIAVGSAALREDPSAWRTAGDIAAPVSTVVAIAVGHPMLAEIYTPNVLRADRSNTDLETNVTGFWLTAHDEAEIVIVSPGDRKVALAGTIFQGPAKSMHPAIRIVGPSRTTQIVRVPAEQTEITIPIDLHRGINRLFVSPEAAGRSASTPESEPPSNAVTVLIGLRILSR
jgi:hypothetical protein